MTDFGSIFSDPVYICGAGPNARPDLIPDDACSIALNRMIAYRRPWTIWLPTDVNCYRYAYWDGADLSTTLMFAPTRVMDNRTDYELEDWAWGGTGAGVALFLAYGAGCRRAILNGVDMYGHHYDGTSSGQDDQTWRQLDKLQSIVDALRDGGKIQLASAYQRTRWVEVEGGMTISSQTETRLMV